MTIGHSSEAPSTLTNFLIEKIRKISEFCPNDAAIASNIAEVNRALFESDSGKSMLAFLLQEPATLLDTLISNLLAYLNPAAKHD